MRIALTMTLSIALAAVALTLSACATSSGGDQDATPTESFTPVGKWSLTKIDDKRYDLPSGARTPTLTIAADGTISGTAGINRYNGTADADAFAQGNWNAGGIVTTKMAGEPQAMAFEQRFIAMLQRADAVQAGPQWLELRTGTRELLRFSRSGQ